jgi:hypothetical protein
MLLKDKPYHPGQIFTEDLRKLKSGSIIKLVHSPIDYIEAFGGREYCELLIFKFVRGKRFYGINQQFVASSYFLADYGCEPYGGDGIGWNTVNWVGVVDYDKK